MSYKYFFDRLFNEVKNLHLNMNNMTRIFNETDSTEKDRDEYLRRVLNEMSYMIDKNHDFRNVEYEEFHDERIKDRETSICEVYYKVYQENYCDECEFCNSDNKEHLEFESINRKSSFLDY